MIAFGPLQAPAPPFPIQAQVGEATTAKGEGMPPRMEALLRAQDWAGLADWFETVPSATRGRYYELWLRSLNRTQRWKRLVGACETLRPKLEAKSGPRLGTYRLYRAQALSQLGRHQEAARAHAENGRLGYPDGLPNACAEARFAQDWKALLSYSDELLKKHPEDVAGMAGKGEALSRLNRLTEAEPIFRAVVAKAPKDALAWNNLGRCLNGKKAWAEACEALDQALALDPNQLEALFNRGLSRFELKRYPESRDDFRAALALRPGDPVIARNLREAERGAALSAPKLP